MFAAAPTKNNADAQRLAKIVLVARAVVIVVMIICAVVVFLDCLTAPRLLSPRL